MVSTAEDGEYFQRPQSKTRIDSGLEEGRTEPIYKIPVTPGDST